MISGQINQVPSISAVVNSDKNLTLRVNGEETISAFVNPQSYIFGSINGVIDITGTIGHMSILSGSISLPKVIGTDIYTGEYEVTPKSFEQELLTKSKNMKNDVLVHKIPYYETSNLTGTTVYIGGD